MDSLVTVVTIVCGLWGTSVARKDALMHQPRTNVQRQRLSWYEYQKHHETKYVSQSTFRSNVYRAEKEHRLLMSDSHVKLCVELQWTDI